MAEFHTLYLKLKNTLSCSSLFASVFASVPIGRPLQAVDKRLHSILTVAPWLRQQDGSRAAAHCVTLRVVLSPSCLPHAFLHVSARMESELVAVVVGGVRGGRGRGAGGVRTAGWMEAEWEGNEIQSESLLLKAVFKSSCVIPRLRAAAQFRRRPLCLHLRPPAGLLGPLNATRNYTDTQGDTLRCLRRCAGFLSPGWFAGFWRTVSFALLRVRMR